MRRFPAAAAGDDVEAAVAPLVPDLRQQHGALQPVGGQHRQQAEFGQISEIVHGEIPAHGGRLAGGGRLDQPPVTGSPYASLADTTRFSSGVRYPPAAPPETILVEGPAKHVGGREA